MIDTGILTPRGFLIPAKITALCFVVVITGACSAGLARFPKDQVHIPCGAKAQRVILGISSFGISELNVDCTVDEEQKRRHSERLTGANKGYVPDIWRVASDLEFGLRGSCSIWDEYYRKNPDSPRGCTFPVEPDLIEAYKWWRLAKDTDGQKRLEEKLSTQQIAAANRRARVWKDKYGEPKLGRKEARQSIAYDLYLSLSKRRDTVAHSWRWLCHAADLGSANAQGLLAHWHRTDIKHSPTWQGKTRAQAGIRPDNRTAYMWYSIASESNNELAIYRQQRMLKESIWTLEKYILSKEEIAQAKRWAQNRKPGQCSGPEEKS